MPWLQMYLVEEDVRLLCQLLDEDPDIALICAAGPGRWKAQRNVPTLRDGLHLFWHIPSGPIELEPTKVKGKNKLVKNPFAGWKEIAKRSNPRAPWIGPGPLGIINLRIRRRAGRRGQFYGVTNARPRWVAPAHEVIGLTQCSWIGDYYEKAPKTTHKWWESLRRRVAKVAQRIPTTGRWTGYPKEVWAFPAALALIQQGVKRADNPS